MVEFVIVNAPPSRADVVVMFTLPVALLAPVPFT